MRLIPFKDCKDFVDQIQRLDTFTLKDLRYIQRHINPLFIHEDQLLSRLWMHVLTHSLDEEDEKHLFPFLKRSNFPIESYRIKTFKKSFDWGNFSDVRTLIRLTNIPDLQHEDSRLIQQSAIRSAKTRRILGDLYQDEEDGQERKDLRRMMARQERMPLTLLELVIQYWENGIRDQFRYTSQSSRRTFPRFLHYVHHLTGMPVFVKAVIIDRDIQENLLLYLISAAYDHGYITFPEFLALLKKYKIEWTEEGEPINKLIVAKIYQTVGRKPIEEIDRYMRSLTIPLDVRKEVIRLKIRSDSSWYGNRKNEEKIIDYAKYIFDRQYLNGEDKILNQMFEKALRKTAKKKSSALLKEVRQTVPYLPMDPSRVKQFQANPQTRGSYFNGGQEFKKTRQSFHRHRRQN